MAACSVQWRMTSVVHPARMGGMLEQKKQTSRRTDRPGHACLPASRIMRGVGGGERWEQTDTWSRQARPTGDDSKASERRSLSSESATSRRRWRAACYVVRQNLDRSFFASPRRRRSVLFLSSRSSTPVAFVDCRRRGGPTRRTRVCAPLPIANASAACRFSNASGHPSR